MLQKVVENWVRLWNAKDIDQCASLMDEKIELRSTQVFKLFPDTGGVIKGKKTIVKYFSMIFEKFPEIQLKRVIIKTENNSVVLSATNGGSVTSHVQYFINEQGKFYLIKADVTDEEYNMAISA